MLNKKYKWLSSIALVVGLAGCGGGGDSDKKDVTPPPAHDPVPVAGKVIDGYVVGATVWLDFDGDGKLDPNEPSVVSTEAGGYLFELTDEEASCVPYSTTYVDVPVGAMDEDLGEVLEAWGQLKRKLTSSGKGNLSCAELKSDTDLRYEIKSEIEDVVRTVVQHFNISDEQIYADFIAKGDSVAYDLAQSIVKGLKASYKHKTELEDQYPDVSEVRVVVYNDGDKDTEYGFDNAWYRDEIMFFDGESFMEYVKLEDTGSLDKVDVVLTKLHEIGVAWGDQSVNGWLNVREDVYINEDQTYRCGNIERVSFEKDGVKYELGNVIPTVDFPTIEECVNTSLENPYERGFNFSYSADDFDYGASFSFRNMQSNFQTLYNWINIKDKAAELDLEEFFSTMNAMPYLFEEAVSMDVESWEKSKAAGGVIISKNNVGEWRRETEQDDGTRLYECGTDGVNWVVCEGR